MQTAVIDYGVGNLASVAQGLLMVGLEPVITKDPEEILQARAVILPGVGAFPKAMENLETLGLIPVIKEVAARCTPFLGICLGMQLLYEESEEHGLSRGLGLLPGKVKRFPEGLKIPHMGWNTLDFEEGNPLLMDIPPRSYTYFVHSYYICDHYPSHVVASTKYGVEFPAIVCLNNIVGMQFHPEKSSRIGLKLLKNFGELVKRC